MSTIQIALIVAVLGAGGFVGVIAAMVGVIQWMLNGLEYREYLLAMRGIIISGRKSVVIWALLLIPLAASVFVLVMTWNDTDRTIFSLTVLALTTFFIGPVLVSRWFNEPWYEQVLAWSVEQSPANWQQSRMRWFYFNLLRLSIGAAACTLFTVALALAH
jgi:uncharacterized membrane protein